MNLNEHRMADVRVGRGYSAGISKLGALQRLPQNQEQPLLHLMAILIQFHHPSFHQLILSTEI